jgi:hypothetical protein
MAIAEKMISSTSRLIILFSPESCGGRGTECSICRHSSVLRARHTEVRLAEYGLSIPSPVFFGFCPQSAMTPSLQIFGATGFCERYFEH